MTELRRRDRLIASSTIAGQEHYGDVIITSHQPDDDHPQPWITVDHADPVTLISAEFLDQLKRDEQRGGGEQISLNGDILTISADNRTVIYRIMEQCPYYLAYVMRWPD